MEAFTYSRPLPWFGSVPWLPEADGARYTSASEKIPSDEACLALCASHDIMPHIQTHCLCVADFATAMARRAVELYGEADGVIPEEMPRGIHPPCPRHLVEITRAAGLLHDIAKSFCIRNGGSHAQLGASWVLDATGNHRIAQAVLHHVEWPWEFPANICSPALFVGYADRRVKHDNYVPIEERYRDLLERYAKNDPKRFQTITAAAKRASTLERALSVQLELPLHACTVDRGRLVPRT